MYFQSHLSGLSILALVIRKSSSLKKKKANLILEGSPWWSWWSGSWFSLLMKMKTFLVGIEKLGKGGKARTELCFRGKKLFFPTL